MDLFSFTCARRINQCFQFIQEYTMCETTQVESCMSIFTRMSFHSSNSSNQDSFSIVSFGRRRARRLHICNKPRSEYVFCLLATSSLICLDQWEPDKKIHGLWWKSAGIGQGATPRRARRRGFHTKSTSAYQLADQEPLVLHPPCEVIQAVVIDRLCVSKDFR